MMIILPYHTRRAWLRSFWLTLALGAGVLTGLLLWGLSPLERVLAGLAVTVVIGIPGLIRPGFVRPVLRAWNALARLFARAATGWLTAVCFYVAIRAMRWMGASLRLSPPAEGESLWTPWPGVPGKRGAPTDGIVVARPGTTGWSGGFVTWVQESRNAWGWALLPVVLILSMFETTQDVETPPPGIYTLY